LDTEKQSVQRKRARSFGAGTTVHMGRRTKGISLEGRFLKSHCRSGTAFPCKSSGGSGERLKGNGRRAVLTGFKKCCGDLWSLPRLSGVGHVCSSSLLGPSALSPLWVSGVLLPLASPHTGSARFLYRFLDISTGLRIEG
jgi:hypothetical protein